MTTTICHEATGITASPAAWRALGFTIYTDGTLNVGRHGIEAILLLGVHLTGGARDESAALAALAEMRRQDEERTRVTAESRMADAVAALARTMGEESAAAFVARLPDRIRPYAEKVLRG